MYQFNFNRSLKHLSTIRPHIYRLPTQPKDKTIKIWKFPEVWVDEQSVVKRAVPHHEKQEETKSESTPISLDDESPAEPGMPSL